MSCFMGDYESYEYGVRTSFELIWCGSKWCSGRLSRTWVTCCAGFAGKGWHWERVKMVQEIATEASLDEKPKIGGSVLGGGFLTICCVFWSGRLGGKDFGTL